MKGQRVATTVRRIGLPLLLALVAAGPLLSGVTAQETEVRPGPELSLLLWHPYPDQADPFGFPYGGGDLDGYLTRYAYLDEEQDGFDFPHMVMDGVQAVEGLPDSGRPYISTAEAYQQAYTLRQGREAPAVLEVSGTLAEGVAAVEVSVLPLTDLGADDVRLWVALVEDHIQYTPPAQVSNGVTDHRFTVRAVQGPLAVQDADPMTVPLSFDLPDGAIDEQIYVTAWLQQGASHGSRFDPHEVVQATTHRLADGGVTRQESRGVLMEVYSATWCDPCLYGDRVADEMQQEYGIATVDVAPERGGYLVAPARPWLVGLAAVAGAVVLAVPRLPGGRR